MTPLLGTLLLTLAGPAQSGAYAKFDRHGETIGLFNLIDAAAECRDKQILTGAALNLRSEVHDPDIVFVFALDLGERRRVVEFTLKKDSIPRADIENLLANKRRYRVSIRACKNGGRWIAEEITR